MSPTAVLAILFVLAVVGYFVGRGRALAASGGRLTNLHSVPGYYGLYVAFWCGIPALLLLVLWLFLGPVVIDRVIMGGLPPEVTEGLSAAQQNLLHARIQNLAGGRFQADASDPVLLAAAERLVRLQRIADWAIAVVALAVAIAGMVFARSRIAPKFRARNAVQRIMTVFMILCSMIAILTTLGIILSLLFESLRFFARVPVTEFLFGLQWSPQTAIRADQAGSSGAFGAVPVHEIVEDIAALQRQIWLYASVLLLVASAVGVLFSRRITSPLHELMRQMRQLEQSDFTAQLQVRSKDEIGLLGARFNQMVRRIERLMAQINRVESGKREAEMRALRHQINPHFLYNTLSTIRWMVKLKNYDGAYKSISSLVKLMEASMEKKGPFNTIESELDLLEKYMDIQRFRYGQQLVLRVECEEDLLPVSVPRMLLQPIVENAVFHGLGPKGGAGTIDVRIARDPGDPEVLRITIEDDGVGIDPGRAGALLAPSAHRNSGMFGIGLRHVHETIQLYYGAESGVKLDGEAGKGTKVTLILDARGRGDYGVQSRAGG